MKEFLSKKINLHKNIYFLIIFAVFLIFFINLFNFTPKIVYADSNHKTQISGYINKFYLSVEDNVKNRTAGSEGEKYMAGVLAQFMSEKNFEYFNGLNSYYQEFDIGDNKTSNNIIGFKNNNAEKYVIIGAHYDSYYIENKSYGYSDNISGMAANAVMADLLLNQTSYNLIVVFFGAEEISYQGSGYFVKNLPDNIKRNTLLFVNFDSVGAGDYLYYYHSDFKTNYGNAIDKILKDNTAVKKYSNQLYAPQTNNEINYVNLPLNSDVSSFLKYGINSFSVFAGNLDNANGFGYFETANHPKIMHNSDTKETIEEVFGDKFIDNINSTIEISYSVLTSAELLSGENFEYGQIPNWAFSDWILKGVGVILVGVGFCVYIILRRRKSV